MPWTYRSMLFQQRLLTTFFMGFEMSAFHFTSTKVYSKTLQKKNELSGMQEIKKKNYKIGEA